MIQAALIFLIPQVMAIQTLSIITVMMLQTMEILIIAIVQVTIMTAQALVIPIVEITQAGAILQALMTLPAAFLIHLAVSATVQAQVGAEVIFKGKIDF